MAWRGVAVNGQTEKRNTLTFYKQPSAYATSTSENGKKRRLLAEIYLFSSSSSFLFLEYGHGKHFRLFSFLFSLSYLRLDPPFVLGQIFKDLAKRQVS